MTERVLLVEDDDDARDALALILLGDGYELETAPDAATALRTLARFTPDVLICDWLLPGDLDGVGVARVVQDRTGARLIFFTAHSIADLRRCTTDLRVDAYLQKPVDVALLRQALTSILDSDKAPGDRPAAR